MCINDYQLIIQPRVTASYNINIYIHDFLCLGRLCNACAVRSPRGASTPLASLIPQSGPETWHPNAFICWTLTTELMKVTWVDGQSDARSVGGLDSFQIMVSVCCTFVGARVESLQRLSTSFYWFAGGHGSNISPWPMKLLMVWNGISRLITLTYLQIFVLSVDKVLLVDGDILSDNLLISACWMRGDAFWLLSCVKAHITRHDKTLETNASH